MCKTLSNSPLAMDGFDRRCPNVVSGEISPLHHDWRGVLAVDFVCDGDAPVMKIWMETLDDVTVDVGRHAHCPTRMDMGFKTHRCCFDEEVLEECCRWTAGIGFPMSDSAMKPIVATAHRRRRQMLLRWGTTGSELLAAAAGSAAGIGGSKVLPARSRREKEDVAAAIRCSPVSEKILMVAASPD
ncbi:hypothetical protein ACLOJK_036653 [Asimina triloba]